MPDGIKSGKVRKFLRIMGGITDALKFVPGIHTPFLPWIEKAIDGAEVLNGPGGGGAKKQLVLDTMTEVFDALESRNVFTVPGELREALPDLVDAIVEMKNTTGAFPKDGDAGTISKTIPTDFRENTAYPMEIQGTVKFKVDP